jgi:hypothetical protein
MKALPTLVAALALLALPLVATEASPAEAGVSTPTQYRIVLLKNNPGPNMTGGEAEDWTAGDLMVKQAEPNCYLGEFNAGRTITLAVKANGGYCVDKFQLKMGRIGVPDAPLVTSYDRNAPDICTIDDEWLHVTTLTIPTTGNWIIYYWVRLRPL